MDGDPATSTRNRGGWTPKALAYIERVDGVLTSLQAYWPLTLRQVYYQLVAAGDIPNTPGEYGKLSRELSRARLSGLVSWEALEDRARAMLRPSYTWPTWQDFARQDVDAFLRGYRRDLLQGQPVAVEVWVEKDALSRVCEAAAREYQVPVVVARGFSSVSFLHDCYTRAARNAEAGQRTVILYFGDLDPSGWEMLPAMLETLQGEMGAGEWIAGKRCALTLAQVEEYALPRNPEALKLTDTRARKYIEQFGGLAVELDALRPEVLEALVRDSIEGDLDLSEFRGQRTLWERDLRQLEDLRASVQDTLQELI